MRKTRRRQIAVLVLASLAVAGCEGFLEVTDSGNLEADQIDPIVDGRTLSFSAQQNFWDAYGDVGLFDAWFTNTARVGDTFPTLNQFGRREVLDAGNGDLNGYWDNLQRGLSSAETVIRNLEGEAEDINLARAYFVSGYSAIHIGEQFCEGTIAISETEPGPGISSAEMLNHAIDRLTKARALATTINGTATLPAAVRTEAGLIMTGSLVGIARAHLQNGRKAEARTFALQVPASFVYNAIFIDDISNRGRLGNNLWFRSESRLSLVVSPEFRAIADAGDTLRVSYQNMNRNAQDNFHVFFRQMKFPGWASPLRIASGLEARYIAAEAGTVADQLALIAERRTFGKQPAFTGTASAEVLRELMEQRTRDFWLEGKRTGDLRRNGEASMPYMLAPGVNNYYKTGLGVVSNQTCLPVPITEKQNNPRWNG